MHVDADRERLRHVPRQWDLPLVTAEAVLLLVVIGLIACGVVVGWTLGHESPGRGATTTVTVSTR